MPQHKGSRLSLRQQLLSQRGLETINDVVQKSLSRNNLNSNSSGSKSPSIKKTNKTKQEEKSATVEEYEIDYELFKAKDFMKRKEDHLHHNRKLKDFYQRYNEKHHVSVFTMAENASQLKENSILISPGVAPKSN